MIDAPQIDAARVLADLRELDRRTGGAEGAERLCWSEGWQFARGFLAELLEEIGLRPETDPAGNAWAFLGAGEEPALVLGSHLDSVPAGGWLDGALGVMAALGVLRAWADADASPPRRLGLVDWADEEGARFGRSLFGSSAVAGSLDPGELAGARDADRRHAAEVLAENGVNLGQAPSASSWLPRVGAYLELHIEQGPRLDDEGVAVAAVDGCVGIERFWLRFDGRASHAGTTPLERRADAALAAAETALAIEWVAGEMGGLATTGALRLEPGVATVIAGRAELSVDLRHRDAEELAQMLAVVRDLASVAAAKRGVRMTETPIWRIDPVRFDPALVAPASELVEGRTMTSGALHDAAEMARAGVPTAMLFCPSIGGVSHSPAEDTREQDLFAAIARFGDLAARAMALRAY